MTLMRELSSNDRIALGAAACIVACTLNTTIAMSNDDVRTMQRFTEHATELLKSTGIDPTTLKDLGLELVGSALGE